MYLSQVRYKRKRPGDSEHLEDVWELKEKIRREEGYLRQTWGFFSTAYKKNVCHLYLEGENIIGFATVRRDGYILFLGVDKEYRGYGIGKSLVEQAEKEHSKVSCHARVSNSNALNFYKHLGFDMKSKVRSYYENGDPAYYLVKQVDESKSFKKKISDILTKSSED